MGGTGQDVMGQGGKGKRKEEGEGKRGEGYSPSNFNSWRRH